MTEKKEEKKYGLVKEIYPTAGKDKNLKNMPEDTKKKYLAEVKEDMQQVKAKFRNLELKGADFHVKYRKHGCEPLQVWDFKDGDSYVVPLGLVNHVNETCRRSYNTLKNGKPEVIYDQLQEFIPVVFS